MRGLITNIFDDAIQMRMGHGKRPVAFLPGKMTPDPSPLVDVIRRPGLDIANQFRRCDVWFQTKEHMGVIGHRIDRNQFLPFSCDNSGDVLLQLFAPGLGNYTSAARHREHNMQIDLRVGVGHFFAPR